MAPNQIAACSVSTTASRGDMGACVATPAGMESTHRDTGASPWQLDPGVAEASRIAHIRRQIADGTYLTAEKIDAAIERLIEDARAPRPRVHRATGT